MFTAFERESTRYGWIHVPKWWIYIYHIYSLILMMSEDGGAVPRRESIAWLVRVHVDWTCSVIQWQPVPNLGKLHLAWWAGGMTMSIDRLPWHGSCQSFVVWERCLGHPNSWLAEENNMFYHTIAFLSRDQGSLVHSVTLSSASALTQWIQELNVICPLDDHIILYWFNQ